MWRGIKWYPATSGNVPGDAVEGGRDADGNVLYIGRALEKGNLIPGKVAPSQGCAYISYGGAEIKKDAYEVLVKGDYNVSWIPAQNGDIPPGNAVVGGNNDAESLYVGRAAYNGTVTPGKIHRSNGCLYIPFNGQEVRIASYEGLVMQPI